MIRFEPRPGHTPEGAALTRAILSTFRLNGALIQAGDELIRDLGVSSAQWQVLGAIALSPITVAQIARDLGRKRQGVQPTVDRLVKRGLVELRENPNHRCAKLVALTKRGCSVLEKISARQEEWVNELASDLSERSLRQMVSLGCSIQLKLEELGGSS
ncbi:MAG: MarR family transcriptional regulator [Acidobacteriota bacterium]